MNIAFRVDSSFIIGTGHVMRCLTLANSLKDLGHECIFICRDFDGNLNYYITSLGYKVVELSHEIEPIKDDYSSWLGTSYLQDIEDCQNGIKDKSIDWLMIDHYGIDIVWEQKMRPFVNNIFVIDDLANRKHDCDILLDQNYVSNMENRYDELVPNSCKKLIGPTYTLLRKEFSQTKKARFIREPNRILVFFGGSDPTNETEKAIHLLTNIPFLEKWQIDVIVSNSNPNRFKIKELCNQYPTINYHCQIENMAEMMAKASFGIMATGSTTWERFCMGLPAITTIVAENQMEIAKSLSKLEIDTILHSITELNEEVISKFIDNIEVKRDRMIEMVDGYGAFRATAHIVGRLRDIQVEDLPIILEWRNQDSIRKYMYHYELIEWENHVNWFEKVSNDNGIKNKIFEVNNLPVGVVTFVTKEESQAEWGFYIGDQNAPKGSGMLLGELALDLAFHSLNIKKVYGEVIDFNQKSKIFHQNFGFTLEIILRDHYIRENNRYDVYVYSLTKEYYKK